jgi:hypothetical protein
MVEKFDTEAALILPKIEYMRNKKSKKNGVLNFNTKARKHQPKVPICLCNVAIPMN